MKIPLQRLTPAWFQTPAKSDELPPAPAPVDVIAPRARASTPLALVPAATSLPKVAVRASGAYMDDLVAEMFEQLDDDRFAFDGDPTRFRLRFSLEGFPTYYLDALGISGARPIVLHVDLPPTAVRNGRPWFGGDAPPRISVALGDARPRWEERRLSGASDKTLVQVNQLVEKFQADHWPPTDGKMAHAYLPALHATIAERLTHLGDFCAVCTEPVREPGIRPGPCDAAACGFAYEQMGIGAGVADIRERPAVAELLLSLAAAAVSCRRNERREHLFASAPVDFLDAKSASGAKTVRWNALAEAFRVLPGVATMQPHDDIPAYLKTVHPQAFALVRWVLNSWRGHLIALPAHDALPMGTTRQFRVCANSPAHERRFAELRAQHGSTFMFHGSDFFNWHAILRESLKNCSGTSLQTSGAVYGSGIYLATDSGTSTYYARGAQGKDWPGGSLGSNARCLALCEVIRGQHTNKADNILVYDRADCVALRYLLVYDEEHVIPKVLAKSLAQACQRHAENIDTALAAFCATQDRAKRRLSATQAGVPPLSQRDTAALRALHDFEVDDSEVGSDDEGSDNASDVSDAGYGTESDDGVFDPVPAAAAAEEAAATREALALHARFGHMSTGMQKRLVKEIRDLARAKTGAEGFEAAPLNDDNLGVWEAKIWAEKDSPLWQQLQTFHQATGRDYITLGLRFPGDYPNEPPFVWVKSPTFMPRTAFVSRGAVCNQMLVNGIDNGWSPINTVETVLRDIRTNLNDPAAHAVIDNAGRDSGYSEQQALDGFAHAKRLHGWGSKQ